MYRARLFGVTVALALGATGAAEQDLSATRSPSNIIIEWNQILQDTIPGAGGPLAPRFYAIAHVAMFDAVNAIEREYEPYHVRLQYRSGSPEAAAAQAAHDVLVALNPPSTPIYDAALAQQLGARPHEFVRRGAAVGARAAKEILEWRANDGWVVTGLPPYVEPLLPGRWQPTPPNNPVAIFTHLQRAAPLALLTSTQYLPPPPPSLTSERYATDLNEVKDLGRIDSATRTADQTVIARLWAGIDAAGTGTVTTNFAIWNNVARDAHRYRRLSLVESARVFALLNVAIHDGLQTTQASKFVYGFWRPVTAIRAAADDLNPATDADPGWLPLITTPAYPSYGGNMAGIGASAARALQLAFRTDEIPVTATWRQSGGQPDISHEFASFSELAEEQSQARIYGGIHYRFDQESGKAAGKAAAEYVYANFMNPKRY